MQGSQGEGEHAKAMEGEGHRRLLGLEVEWLGSLDTRPRRRREGGRNGLGKKEWKRANVLRLSCKARLVILPHNTGRPRFGSSKRRLGLNHDAKAASTKIR
jgi:hypothetical protein